MSDSDQGNNSWDSLAEEESRTLAPLISGHEEELLEVFEVPRLDPFDSHRTPNDLAACSLIAAARIFSPSPTLTGPR